MIRNFWHTTLLATTIVLSMVPAGAINLNPAQVVAQSADDSNYKAADLSNKAIAAIQSNNWEQAQTLLDEAVKLDPNSASCLVHTNLALVNEHFNKFDEACANLKTALKFSPNDRSALEDMGSYYQQIGDVKSAIPYFEHYLQLYPTASDTPTIRQLVTRFKSMKAANVDPNAKDYFNEANTGTYHRYRTPRGPLKVYIYPPESVPGYKPEYGQYFDQALDGWTQASGVLSWQKVDSPQGADIVCKWSTDIVDPKGNTQPEAGRAESQAMGHEIVHSVITLFTVPAAGAEVNDESIKYACFHEVGHALGLTGHSPHPEDIMFFSNRENQEKKLTDRDKATIAKLYSTAI